MQIDEARKRAGKLIEAMVDEVEENPDDREIGGLLVGFDESDVHALMTLLQKTNP